MRLRLPAGSPLPSLSGSPLLLVQEGDRALELARPHFGDRGRADRLEEFGEVAFGVADQRLDIDNVVGLDERVELGLGAVVVIGGGKAERQLERVPLQIGGGRADRLDGVLVAALVVGGFEAGVLAVAVGMADPADDPEPLARLLAAEAIREAVARQRRIDGGGDRGEVLIAVVRAALARW